MGSAQKQLASVYLAKRVHLVFSLPKEPSARTLLQDDVILIALGLSIQLPFHLAQHKL